MALMHLRERLHIPFANARRSGGERITVGSGHPISLGIVERDEENISRSEQVLSEPIERGGIAGFKGRFRRQREGCGDLAGLFAHDVVDAVACLRRPQPAGASQRQGQETHQG